MRRVALVVCLLMFLPAFAFGQQSSRSGGQGYGFVAPGGVSGGGASLHFGAGGEGFVYKGLGVGAELGYLAPPEALSAGFGIFSANASYHFLNASQSGKLVPFVTGGYSLGFRGGAVSGGNVGGGLHYWFKERAGLRFEFRDHVFTGGSPHFYQVRVGFSFR